MELLALQVDVEPVDDVLQALNPVPGSARARQLVRLAGEADHDDGAPQVLQSTEHLFAAGGRRRAVVGLPFDEHERRLDVLDVAERRARAVIVGLLPGRALEPGRLEQREVGGVPPGGPVGDGALRDGRGEPVAVSDQPGGQNASAASAGDAEPVLIDVTAPDEIIHAREQVLRVIPRIAILDDVAELLPVGRAAPGVGIQDDVAPGGHRLELVEEVVAVGGVRPAMNVEDQRIFFAGIEVRRLLHPGLDLPAVEAGIPDFLRLAEIEPGEELVVDVGQPGQLAVATDEIEIADAGRRGDQDHDARAVGCGGPCRHLLVAGGDRLRAPGLDVEAPQVGCALIGDGGDHRVAVRRPEGGRLGAAARGVLVADDAGADVPIEVGRHRPRPGAGRRVGDE